MIDLNTLVSNALTAAVQQAVAPLNERIATLEEKVSALTTRVVALENNPAQGVDTQATPTTGLTREQVEAMIEQSMDHHLECYDHDDYDSAVSKLDDMPDFDDYVTRDSVREEIEDVINNATLSLSI